MKMKRLLIILTAALLVTGSSWAKDDEVIVTRQITMSQRGALPEKTIDVETKQLIFNKKAQVELTTAITQMMDTIAQEDYQNRTFVMLLEPKANGEIAIAVRNDDIVTRGRQDATIYYGDMAHGRYHFVVLTTKDNGQLLERTFKRQGKVKFVQEFEFVDFKTPNYPTNGTGHWSPNKGFSWESIIINEDPNPDMDNARPQRVRIND
jgi:hypothetical protein